MPRLAVGASDALVVVDLQVDFCPGGALEVREGDQVVAPVNRLLAVPGWLKVATRDWHPPGHVSFKAQGGAWPPHCVAGSPGARFHAGMDASRVDFIVSKATRRDADAYSGFEGTALAADLRSRGVRRIFVCGLATDYCVRATALDGRREGLEVVVVEDAVRAVDLKPGDGARALDEMRGAGCAVARSGDIAA